jgi:hypothetical protein
MTTTFQHPRTAAHALTESPLPWSQRQRAYAVARFINVRLGQGRSEAVILDQIKQCWPDLANDVLY